MLSSTNREVSRLNKRRVEDKEMRLAYAKTAAVAAAVTMLAAGPALAVTVTNQSDKSHEVTVDLGDKEPKTTIEAGKSAKLDCAGGCELRVTGMGYGLPGAPGEKLVIGKDSILAYEGQKTEVEARNSADGKSSAN
jgi:hypothetical protein